MADTNESNLAEGLDKLSLEDATKVIIHRCDVTGSPNDKRKYRLLRLENGLRCLLVSNGYRDDIVRVPPLFMLPHLTVATARKMMIDLRRLPCALE
jgi:hypothetical protein